MLRAMHSSSVALPVSYLFVPATRCDRLPKALASGADAVIVDLEDAVAPPERPAARQALSAWLRSGAHRGTATGDAADARPGARLLVRINAPSAGELHDDLRVAGLPGVDGVVVAKAERVEDLLRVGAALPERVLLPLVETAAGLAEARALAHAPGVQRLVFGSIDFQADLGLDDGEEALWPFRAELVLASRLAGLAAPVDGVTLALDDPDQVLRDTRRARSQGFGAKLCIHPRQLEAVRRGFAPTEAELSWAQRVVDAAQAAQGGAVALDGLMIDTPVVLRAQAVLARAQTSC